MPSNVRRAPSFACIAFSLATIALACGSEESAPHLTDRLVLVRPQGIVELSLATGDERVLIAQQPDSFLQDPAVSPDRTRLAYSLGLAPPVLPGEEPDFGSDLYIAAIDGTDPELVLEHGAPNEHFRWPAWYPDGQLLISTQRLVGAGFELALERFDVASGNRTPLLEGAFRPEVSPDGSLVAYVTQEPDTFAQALWVANADGSGARMLAGSSDGYASFEVPRFSPDGMTLAFAASQAPVARGEEGIRYASRSARRAAAGTLNGFPMDIWNVDAAGGPPTLLADLKLDGPSVAWSGDAERLFVYSGSGLFVVMMEDGSTYRIGEGTYHGQMAWLGAE